MNRGQMTEVDAEIYDRDTMPDPCPMCGKHMIENGVCHSLRCMPDDGSALFVAGCEESSRLAIAAVSQ